MAFSICEITLAAVTGSWAWGQQPAQRSWFRARGGHRHVGWLIPPRWASRRHEVGRPWRRRLPRGWVAAAWVATALVGVVP